MQQRDLPALATQPDLVGRPLHEVRSQLSARHGFTTAESYRTAIGGAQRDHGGTVDRDLAGSPLPGGTEPWSGSRDGWRTVSWAWVRRGRR